MSDLTLPQVVAIGLALAGLLSFVWGILASTVEFHWKLFGVGAILLFASAFLGLVALEEAT